MVNTPSAPMLPSTPALTLKGIGPTVNLALKNLTSLENSGKARDSSKVSDTGMSSGSIEYISCPNADTVFVTRRSVLLCPAKASTLNTSLFLLTRVTSALPQIRNDRSSSNSRRVAPSSAPTLNLSRLPNSFRNVLLISPGTIKQAPDASTEVGAIAPSVNFFKLLSTKEFWETVTGSDDNA